MANHTGDLGALAGDIGFLPTASYCGRIRGDWLNMTAVLCGNRFGRGWLRPGGVRHAIDAARRQDLLDTLAAFARDFAQVNALMLGARSVRSRLRGTGIVSTRAARELGLVGLAARASGVARVSYDGRTVDYRSLAEIDRAIEALDREIAAAEGRPIVRQVRVITTKGL